SRPTWFPSLRNYLAYSTTHQTKHLPSEINLPFLAQNLRLDRPLLLIKGLPLRSDKRQNRAPLTARTARRLSPPRRAFAFYAPLCASPLRSKDQSFRKETFFYAGNQQTTCFRARPDRRNTGRFGRA